MKSILLALALLSVTSHANALDISCFDESIQDGQFTATFVGEGADLQVVIFIPQGETFGELAGGSCVTEEDTAELSLRCDDVRTESGEKYFARIDGDKATIAKDGKILATPPCRANQQ